MKEGRKKAKKKGREGEGKEGRRERRRGEERNVKKFTSILLSSPSFHFLTLCSCLCLLFKIFRLLFCFIAFFV